jgi:hypothetical protein
MLLCRALGYVPVLMAICRSAGRNGIRHHALILLGYSCWLHSYPQTHTSYRVPVEPAERAKVLIVLLIVDATKA